MGRVALVTGGSRGIGAAISAALKEAGYTVAANYAGNDEAARAFSAETGIAVFKWDVSDHAACAAGVAQVEEQLGGIDVLVNNAGISRDGFLHKMPEENWDLVIDVDLNSCFHMSQAVLNGMRGRGFGRIVSISSINGQAGMMGVVNYAAAKAGMLGFTKALALENAFKGITVNAICPGYVKTDLIAHVSDEVMGAIVKRIPVGRIGEPEEIARCVTFLAADDAGFITGSTLSVNGGAYMA
ncbi:MAG: acetoacetyl-CoA reductase [Alphaproteobacteria bacterium]|jgi:acetoacetyl-CoA reductase|nr:acetoacetyl-CoA reductase [Rhodospirillaceae bacterium]MBT6206161.1 acetoacetyl-CoA reductase [Rhodospirillaceae bacterium]MBT6509021.1 acetoacetyl-CoA reductase [Rhodospirillaceae bacterium]MDG2480307.1 acetoacetyl-CoA reductase [Alphaproteobacteria bacterium]